MAKKKGHFEAKVLKSEPPAKEKKPIFSLRSPKGHEKRPAFNEVLSEQIVVLDSLTKGLPTMLTLPTEELEPIYQEVIQWGK